MAASDSEQAMHRVDRMAALGVLSAGIAHEINNPLAYVVANLDEALSELSAIASSVGTSNGEASSGEAPVGRRLAGVLRALREARDGAEHIRLIARDVKTFSRGVDDRSAPVDLRRVLDATVRITLAEVRKRATLVRDDGPMPAVEGTEASLGQVFLNLLINATQAIPPGHPERHSIWLSTWTDPAGRAVVQVRDSGDGIPADMLDRIFQPFFTTMPEGVGTGLGLSICHDIVTRLGGVIEVESEPGRGTAFRVVLPPSTGVIPPRSEPSLARARVLVIDDDPVVGEALRHILERECDVLVVTSAPDALRALADPPPFDAILCDLEMPGTSGAALFASAVQSSPALADAFGFVSGGVSSPEAVALLSRVPNPVFGKPFDPDDLLAFVRDRVRQSRRLG